ncbi:hypothetical protein ACLOJK_023754 [Asimina triloba]
MLSGVCVEPSEEAHEGGEPCAPVEYLPEAPKKEEHPLSKKWHLTRVGPLMRELEEVLLVGGRGVKEGERSTIASGNDPFQGGDPLDWDRTVVIGGSSRSGDRC